MKRSVIVAAILAIAAGAVVAQVDIIKERREIMKGVGKATGDLAKVMKGEAAFDLKQAQDAVKIYADAGKKMPKLFPDNTKVGGDTAALPKIWEAKADFEAKFAKLKADAEKLGPTVKDEASFKAAFGEVTKNCGGCHETYRAKPKEG
jgi:cytochrome c556